MTVGVIGAGTMGSGIAQIAATADNQVLVFDQQDEALTKSKTQLEKVLSRLIEKNRIDTDEKNRIQSNLTYTSSLSDLATANLVIEAIVENLEIKQKLFKSLEDLVSKDAILASNTSSLSIASIASALQNPNRCIGLHFFNPAPLMKLVEVIPAVQTDEAVIHKSIKILKEWKKSPALAKDTPGFIVNRVARPFYGEALRIYEEGIANFATIDWAMKNLGKFRMGPFELMDFIGNDVNYTVTETVFKAFYYDPRYKPSFTQKRFAEAGYLGRKSGRGYYNYAEDAPKPTPNQDEALAKLVFERILVMLINEAADALFMNIANAKDIDLAMKGGVNYPKGLLAWANEKGIEWCVEKMDNLYDTYREDRYRCSPILRKMLQQNKTFELS
jgi:3-hydroxybutyryl-CoA dehydrogenase